MKITIEYCTQWGYEFEALSLRESLVNRFGVEVDLIQGSDGIFNVKFLHTNNATSMLFSKEEVGRFPNTDEVEDLIEGYNLVKWENH